MFNKILLFITFSFMFLLSSCSKQKEGLYWLRNEPLSSKNLYYEGLYSDISFSDDVDKRENFIFEYFPNEELKDEIKASYTYLGDAPAARKLALYMANNCYSYCFNVPVRQMKKDAIEDDYYEEHAFCVLADGVSNFIYNVSYLANVPKKLLLSPFYSVTFMNWVSNIIIILWGTFMSLIFLFLGTILGTLCNPIDTFANLFIGFIPILTNVDIHRIHDLFYFIPTRENIFSNHYGRYWLTYVISTNLIASLWDLIKGIVLPLWQTIIIAKYHPVYFSFVVFFLLLGAKTSKK